MVLTARTLPQTPIALRVLTARTLLQTPIAQATLRTAPTLGPAKTLRIKTALSPLPTAPTPPLLSIAQRLAAVMALLTWESSVTMGMC